MRLIDEQGNPIMEDDCDLTKGEIIDTTWVDPKAYDTIDNVTKFALDDDDYEQVRMYRLFTDMDYQAQEDAAIQERNERLLDNLEDFQADTDAAVCDLYEQGTTNSDHIADQDAAICELYELIIGA